jgi:hypothetical protein
VVCGLCTSPPAESCWGSAGFVDNPGREQSHEPIFYPLSCRRGGPFGAFIIAQRSSRKLRVAGCPPRVPRRILVLIRCPCSLGRARWSEPGPCCLNQDWTEEGPKAGVPSCPLSPSDRLACTGSMRPPFSPSIQNPHPDSCWAWFWSTGHSSSSPRPEIPKGPPADVSSRSAEERQDRAILDRWRLPPVFVSVEVHTELTNSTPPPVFMVLPELGRTCPS